MAAAPYKVVMTVRNAAGQVTSMPMAGSDVTTAAWTYPSAGTEIALSQQDAVITDVCYSAAGTDTSQVQVWINGKNSGYIIYNAMNVYNVLQRQVAQSGIPIPRGAFVKFIQIT